MSKGDGTKVVSRLKVKECGGSGAARIV